MTLSPPEVMEIASLPASDFLSGVSGEPSGAGPLAPRPSVGLQDPRRSGDFLNGGLSLRRPRDMAYNPRVIRCAGASPVSVAVTHRPGTLGLPDSRIRRTTTAQRVPLK